MTPIVASLLLLVQAVANAELGYRLTVPEGFVAFPEGRSQRDVVDCWTEDVPASPGGALVLCVQRMHGTLGRERMTSEGIPPGTQLRTFQWHGFEIEGVRTDTAQEGNPVVVLAAQVPLRGEAVQLILGGPADQAERAEALMTATLASLEGETNWLTSEQRAERLGNIVGLAIGVGVVLLGIRIWRTRRRSRAA